MKSPITWFLLLASVCLAGPYAFGVRPRTRRHWVALAITIGFLAWLLLPLATGLRSR